MKRAAIAALLCLSLCSILFSIPLIGYYEENTAQREQFEALRQIVVSPSAVSAPQEEALPDIRALRARNGDCVGWIRIPGTMIDYPVMQSAKAPEFYLDHNFSGEESPHGVPFADARCGITSSENLIVYGHQMHDGTMFSELLGYEEEAFLRDHPTVEFFTLDGKHTYHVFAVLRTTGTARPEDGWSVFHSIDLAPGDFAQFVSHCQENSLVSSDGEPAPGDRLLTLVTCEYSQEDGRLAVVAYEEK